MSGCGDKTDKSDQGKSVHAESGSIKGQVIKQAEAGFKTGGDRYDSFRPNYTEEAVDIIASEIISKHDSDPSDLKYHVLELGAGTGKLTEQLSRKLPQYLRYLATDQSENFLGVLSKKSLNVDVKVAVADSLPLPDNCVSSVVCAQSFHWFSSKKDLDSIRRVMIPGGKLILIWNMKNFEAEWMTAFYEQRKEVVAKVGGSMNYLVNSGEWRRHIDVSSDFKLEWHKSLEGTTYQGDIEKMLANLTTISAYNALPSDEREKYIDELRQVVTNWPGVDVNNITIPFTTEVYLFVAQ